MQHKLCRSFHPWGPGVKTRCLLPSSDAIYGVFIIGLCNNVSAVRQRRRLLPYLNPTCKLGPKEQTYVKFSNTKSFFALENVHNMAAILIRSRCVEISFPFTYVKTGQLTVSWCQCSLGVVSCMSPALKSYHFNHAMRVIYNSPALSTLMTQPGNTWAHFTNGWPSI